MSAYQQKRKESQIVSGHHTISSLQNRKPSSRQPQSGLNPAPSNKISRNRSKNQPTAVKNILPRQAINFHNEQPKKAIKTNRVPDQPTTIINNNNINFFAAPAKNGPIWVVQNTPNSVPSQKSRIFVNKQQIKEIVQKVLYNDEYKKVRKNHNSMQSIEDPYSVETSVKTFQRRESTKIVPTRGLFRDNSVQQLDLLEERKDYQPEMPYLNKNMNIHLPIQKTKVVIPQSSQHAHSYQELPNIDSISNSPQRHPVNSARRLVPIRSTEKKLMLDGPSKDPEILNLSRQILNVEYQNNSQIESDQKWLFQQAQILQKERKIESIGLNKALEKTQRIKWRQSSSQK